MKIVISFFILFVSLNVYALPFNDDMVNNQLKTGSVMRPKPNESVAVGSLSYAVKDKDAATALKNPVARDEFSESRGKRLFSVNCLPCHGNIEAKEYMGGPVAAKFVMPPTLISDFYREKSDGYIYATIHFGGMAVMPPLGWKLSPNEHWDIVNYVRSVQDKNPDKK